MKLSSYHTHEDTQITYFIFSRHITIYIYICNTIVRIYCPPLESIFPRYFSMPFYSLNFSIILLSLLFLFSGYLLALLAQTSLPHHLCNDHHNISYSSGSFTNTLRRKDKLDLPPSSGGSM